MPGAWLPGVRLLGKQVVLHNSVVMLLRFSLAILVQVASPGLDVDCRCHGEEGAEEMQQAQMPE